MADANATNDIRDERPSVLPTARSFPDRVPILIDAEARITLRALGRDDLAAIVEQCSDPEMIRWTTVPTPTDGYQLRDAEEFLALTAAGWTSGQRLSWTIEGQRGSRRRFCGSIDLRIEGDEAAEVGFGLHPEARGRSIMSAALNLVCDYGFEVVGLEVIRWRAAVGNWASRRVASKVGFVFDGTVRRSLAHRGELLDGWVATLTRDDPRVPQPWLRPVDLCGDGVRLRAFGPGMSTALWKHALIRIRPTGLPRCLSPMGLTAHTRTCWASPSWPHAEWVWPGASPIRTTTAAWARSAWMVSGAMRSAARSAIGRTLMDEAEASLPRLFGSSLGTRGRQGSRPHC
jgi:RimJ/RimL family protein N-acetyltransferase